MNTPASERTVVHALRRAVRERPDHPWIITEDTAVTFRDMDLRSNRLAHGLLAQGMRAGDTVLVMMADHTDFIALWVAISKIGAVEVPVNTSYRGDILTHVTNDSRARLMIIGEEFVDRLAMVRPELNHLQQVVVHGKDGIAAPVSVWEGALPFAALLAAAEDAPLHEPVISDLMSVMYTSGTTGLSKGVMVCHAHAYVYADANTELLDITRADVFYSGGLPMFHVAGKWGVFLNAAINCCTAALPVRFSAARYWDDIRHFRATKSFLLGAMGNMLQRQPPLPTDREHTLRKAIMAPLVADLKDFVSRFGVSLCSAYGSTELNVPILFPNADSVDDPSTVGKVRADLFEVRIVDDNDMEVAAGVVGEIVVRPKQPWLVALGYWQHPEWTAAAWRNLWFHSGDAGRYDADGTFYFIDRKKDAIRRRGENISSMEVEGVISQHPGVQECAVFPVSSEFTEQEVMVAVVEKPGVPFDPVQFIRFLEPKMAYFMVPRYVDVVDMLPKTPSGKIIKVDLRARGVTPTTWDREAAGIKLSR